MSSGTPLVPKSKADILCLDYIDSGQLVKCLVIKVFVLPVFVSIPHPWSPAQETVIKSLTQRYALPGYTGLGTFIKCFRSSQGR